MKHPDPLVFGPQGEYGPVPYQADWRGFTWPMLSCRLHPGIYWASEKLCWMCRLTAHNRLIA